MLAADVVEQIRHASDVNDLQDLVDAYARHVGMDGAYIMHFHPAVGLTFVDKRHEEWRNIYTKRGFIHFDPIATRAFQGGTSFTFEECIDQSSLTGDQRALLSMARDYGLNQGFHVVGKTGDYEAFACGYYNRDAGIYMDTMRISRDGMERVGQAARARMSELVLRNVVVPKLTPREKEYLELAGCGKTNDVIGAILGISANTVNSYIKSASEKLNVNTKIQAVVKAVQLKIIFPLNI